MDSNNKDRAKKVAGGGLIAGGAIGISKSMPYVTGRRTYFHGTSEKHAEKIRGGAGIRPSSKTGAKGVLNEAEGRFPKSWADHAYVSDSRIKAGMYGIQSSGMTGSKPVILKVSSRDWGDGRKGIRTMPNPETAGGVEAMAERMSQKLPKNSMARKILEKDPSVMSGAHKVQSWGNEQATPGVSSRRIKGSVNYQKLTLGEIAAYAKARPKRFLKGVGGAALGAGSIIGGGMLIAHRNETSHKGHAVSSLSAITNPMGFKYPSSAPHQMNIALRKTIIGKLNSVIEFARGDHQFSAIQEHLIQFAGLQPDDAAPRIDSWNPIKRSRQHKKLEKWVKQRSPSAGIAAEDLHDKYPAPTAGRRAVGAAIGSAVGIGASALLAKNTNIHGQALIAVPAIGAAAGAFLAAPRAVIEHHKKMREARELINDHFENHSVDVSKLKTTAPIATSHMKVAGELKKQGAGFFRRHATALATYPMRNGNNAAFVPYGDKGVIVSGEEAPRAIIAHEDGHAKDYRHYGSYDKAFAKAYPAYGQPTGRLGWIRNTMLPEERAWKHAGKLNKHEQKVRDAALATYSGAGNLFSAIQNHLIQFADPRPRNSLGEFSGNAEGVPSPASMHKTYGQGLMQGAALGAGGVGAGVATKALLDKLRKAKK